jgi:two-component system, OmpR family, sensor histidine kinase KdpD
VTRECARPDPDALLALIKGQETPTRGRLRIYLGAAPGVGKTFAMLQEAHRRKDRGTDVVVGFVETHGRPHTAEQIGDLEVVPAREIHYKGVVLREMDTEAVIAREPMVALVDELAHTNAPGSKHAKRHEDVADLLDAGITVISTLNIQHLESLNDYVEQMTGVTVHETVPDWVVDEAEQVELIDMAPEALIQRMKHGNIYPPEQARRALDNFFTAGNLTALRDLALRATAKEVEQKLDAYMRDLKIEGTAAVGERVMVAVDHRPIGKTLIRRGWRLAAALKGELVVVYVEPTGGKRRVQTIEDERQLRANLQLADELGAMVVRLRGAASAELIAYARAHHVGSVVIGHPTHGRWEEFLHGSVTSDMLRKLPGIDVHVMADGSEVLRKEREDGAT